MRGVGPRMRQGGEEGEGEVVAAIDGEIAN